MGGEWKFTINEKGVQSLDLDQYQKKLKELKEEHQVEFKDNPDESDIKIVWYESIPPPSDNIFASFSYKPSTGTPYSWKIFWNPKIVPEAEQNAVLNTRIATEKFQRIGVKLQKKLCDLFPTTFELEINDDERGLYIPNRGFQFSDYDHHQQYYGDYEYYDEREALGLGNDFAACDKECGYCGNCPY